MTIPTMLQAIDVRYSKDRAHWVETPITLEWRHVISLRDPGPYFLCFSEAGGRQECEVTEVVMPSGPVLMLKHPYKELLKAFLASRGET